MTSNIDRLAEVIRRVDGDHTLGAGALAEALDDAGCRMSDVPEWHVHAAVAEIVRLKQAIARLRDAYAAPDDPGDDYGRGAESAYQIVARDLTSILEGEA